MRYFTFLLIFITTQAFSSEVCRFEETWEFREEFSATGKSTNHRKFTFAEKNLVHRTIVVEESNQGASRAEAIEAFSRSYTEGEILYFDIDGKKLALVHYYPGDNEYGAFYEVRFLGVGKLIAIVSDSFISCIEE